MEPHLEWLNVPEFDTLRDDHDYLCLLLIHTYPHFFSCARCLHVTMYDGKLFIS